MSNKNIEFDDAWLGLGDLTKLQIPNNPLIHRTEKEIELFGMEIHKNYTKIILKY